MEPAIEPRFFLSPEHRRWLAEFREFLAEKVSPLATEIERRGKIPAPLLGEFMRRGFTRWVYPQSLNSPGGDYFTLGLLMREIAAAEPNLSVYCAVQNSIIATTLKQLIHDTLPPELRLPPEKCAEQLESMKFRLTIDKDRLLDEFSRLPIDLRSMLISPDETNPLPPLAWRAEWGRGGFPAPLQIFLDKVKSHHRHTRIGRTLHQYLHFFLPFIRGECLGTFCLSEPDAGSDATALKTTAIPIADGDLFHSRFVLNGSKTWISFGADGDILAGNLFHIVIAQSSWGPLAFLVPEGIPGLAASKIPNKIYLDGSGTASLFFTDCPLDGRFLLGEPGDGFRVAFGALDQGRVGIASQGYGYAHGALRSAQFHAARREQLGRPIKYHPSLGRLLGEMKGDTDGAGLLIRFCSHLQAIRAPVGLNASLAKYHATEMALAVSERAVQIKGGYGYSREDPAGRSFMAAKVSQIYEGTNQIQALLVASQLYQEETGKKPLHHGWRLWNDLAIKLSPESRESLDPLSRLFHRILRAIILRDGEGTPRKTLDSDQEWFDWVNQLPPSGPSSPLDMKGGARFHQKFNETRATRGFARLLIAHLARFRAEHRAEAGISPWLLTTLADIHHENSRLDLEQWASELGLDPRPLLPSRRVEVERMLELAWDWDIPE